MDDVLFNRADRPQASSLQEPRKAVIHGMQIPVRLKANTHAAQVAEIRSMEPGRGDVRIVHESPFRVSWLKYLGKHERRGDKEELEKRDGGEKPTYDNYRGFMRLIDEDNADCVGVKKEENGKNTERELLAKISHESITNLYHVFLPESGTVYIALTYSPYTLHELLNYLNSPTEKEVHMITKSVSYLVRCVHNR